MTNGSSFPGPETSDAPPSRRETVTGELLRRRNARDMWISRGHLYAIVMLVVVSSATFFVVGFVLGRHVLPPERIEAGANAADDELARVLTSIDMGTHPVGGERPGTPARAERPAPSSLSVPAGDGLPPPVDAAAPPVDEASLYTVVVGESATQLEAGALEASLLAHGLWAWTEYSLVDGAPQFRVAVGGYDSAEGAALVLPVVRAAGFDGHVSPIR